MFRYFTTFVFDIVSLFSFGFFCFSFSFLIIFGIRIVIFCFNFFFVSIFFLSLFIIDFIRFFGSWLGISTGLPFVYIKIPKFSYFNNLGDYSVFTSTSTNIDVLSDGFRPPFFTRESGSVTEFSYLKRCNLGFVSYKFFPGLYYVSSHRATSSVDSMMYSRHAAPFKFIYTGVSSTNPKEKVCYQVDFSRCYNFTFDAGAWLVSYTGENLDSSYALDDIRFNKLVWVLKARLLELGEISSRQHRVYGDLQLMEDSWFNWIQDYSFHADPSYQEVNFRVFDKSNSYLRFYDRFLKLPFVDTGKVSNDFGFSKAEYSRKGLYTDSEYFVKEAESFSDFFDEVSNSFSDFSTSNEYGFFDKNFSEYDFRLDEILDEWFGESDVPESDVSEAVSGEESESEEERIGGYWLEKSTFRSFKEWFKDLKGSDLEDLKMKFKQRDQGIDEENFNAQEYKISDTLYGLFMRIKLKIGDFSLFFYTSSDLNSSIEFGFFKYFRAVFYELLAEFSSIIFESIFIYSFEFGGGGFRFIPAWFEFGFEVCYPFSFIVLECGWFYFLCLCFFYFILLSAVFVVFLKVLEIWSLHIYIYIYILRVWKLFDLGSILD